MSLPVGTRIYVGYCPDCGATRAGAALHPTMKATTVKALAEGVAGMVANGLHVRMALPGEEVRVGGCSCREAEGEEQEQPGLFDAAGAA